MLSAAIRSGFIQMRMAKVRPPRMSALLHAADRGQARLDEADEIIGYLVRLKDVGGEAQIGGGELRVGRLDVDDRDFGFRREIAPDLRPLSS